MPLQQKKFKYEKIIFKLSKIYSIVIKFITIVKTCKFFT